MHECSGGHALTHVGDHRLLPVWIELQTIQTSCEPTHTHTHTHTHSGSQIVWDRERQARTHAHGHTYRQSRIVNALLLFYYCNYMLLHCEAVHDVCSVLWHSTLLSPQPEAYTFIIWSFRSTYLLYTDFLLMCCYVRGEMCNCCWKLSMTSALCRLSAINYLRTCRCRPIWKKS